MASSPMLRRLDPLEDKVAERLTEVTNIKAHNFEQRLIMLEGKAQRGTAEMLNVSSLW